MNRERMERAITIMEKAANQKIKYKGKSLEFDMSYWFKEGSCGTVACALGHMALDDIFNAEGLNVSMRVCESENDIKYDCYSGYMAAAAFFKIASSEAEWIFCPESGYSTPEQVIERLKTTMNRFENVDS